MLKKIAVQSSPGPDKIRYSPDPVLIRALFCYLAALATYACWQTQRVQQRWAWTGLDILQDTCDFFGSGLDLDIYFWKIESGQDHDIGLISITKFPWEQRRSSHLDILDWSRGGKIRWSGKNWPTTVTYIVENILHFQKYSLEHKIGIDLTVSSTLKMPSKNYTFLFWDVSDYS